MTAHRALRGFGRCYCAADFGGPAVVTGMRSVPIRGFAPHGCPWFAFFGQRLGPHRTLVSTNNRSKVGARKARTSGISVCP